MRNCTSGGSLGSVPVIVGLSVIAYLTTSGNPIRRMISSTTSGLIGAVADVPIRTCDRSVVSSSASRSSRSHWVGTAATTEIFSSAMSRSISTGASVAGLTTTVTPLTS